MNQAVQKQLDPAGILVTILAVTALATTGVIQSIGMKIKNYEPIVEPGYSTVMVYMDGSDLESDYGCAAIDLKEMEDAVAVIDPEGKRVRVVVEAGGATEWVYPAMNEHEYGRFCITGKGVSEVEDIGVRDMGRSDTLADFINYGTQGYPAEHYGLICWNHGEGQIGGFGSDSLHNDSSLSLSDIENAFARSSLTVPLDFMAMDACLMGDIELVCMLQERVDYFVASEELEPQDGYDYSWMEVLDFEAEQGREWGKAVGEAMLDSYESFYKEKDYKLTLSLVDVNAYPQFQRIMNMVLGWYVKHSDNEKDAQLEKVYEELCRQRDSLQGFGSIYDSRMPEQVDMMELLALLVKLEFKEDTGADAFDYGMHTSVSLQNIYMRQSMLNEAYSKLVIRTVAEGYQSAPCGLSIYLPGGDNENLVEDVRKYEDMNFCSDYQHFVDAYKKFLCRKYHIDYDEPTEDSDHIRLMLDGEQMESIADAYVTTYYQEPSGECYMISADGDVILDMNGFLEADKETQFWGIQGQILCMIENYDTELGTEYLSPIMFRKGNGNWEQGKMLIWFSEDEPDGSITAIVPDGVSKRQYELEEGDAIIPLYPLQEEEERESWHKGNIIVIKDMDAGDGEPERIQMLDKSLLHYGFLIRDVKMTLYYLMVSEADRGIMTGDRIIHI